MRYSQIIGQMRRLKRRQPFNTELTLNFIYSSDPLLQLQDLEAQFVLILS